MGHINKKMASASGPKATRSGGLLNFI